MLRNYRPVSNLLLIAKIIEKGVYNQLSFFFNSSSHFDRFKSRCWPHKAQIDAQAGQGCSPGAPHVQGPQIGLSFQLQVQRASWVVMPFIYALRLCSSLSPSEAWGWYLWYLCSSLSPSEARGWYLCSSLQKREVDICALPYHLQKREVDICALSELSDKCTTL